MNAHAQVYGWRFKLIGHHSYAHAGKPCMI